MNVRQSFCLMLFMLFLCFPLFSLGADTISASQSLSGDQTLLSSGENFKLGFFQPGNSPNYYIGIWYNKISPQTIVWVANRDQPVSDKSASELKILDGNLVLLNQAQTQIWSTDLNYTASNSVIAVLGNDGNLVLRQSNNSADSIWESFDYPTHTWLPGGKVGYNKRTRTKQLLISWKNVEDPAPGLFSVEFDPIGRQYLLRWNRTVQYWTSGAWDAQAKMFSLVPEMRLNSAYNFSFVNNENESYFTYALSDTQNTPARFIMDVSGQIRQPGSQAWNIFWTQPSRQCEVYSFCGAFGSCSETSFPFCSCLQGFEPRLDSDWNLADYSGGCARRTRLQCMNPNATNGKRDRFWTNYNVKLPQLSQNVSVGSAGDCESTCLNNCNCTAHAYDSDGCLIWNGDLLNLQQLSQDDGNGRTINIKLAASEFHTAKNNNGIVIGAVVGSVVVALVILALVGFGFWRRQRTLISNAKTVEGSLVAFGYRDLQNVTKNFSEKLGGGGFGSVFKGTLSDSTVIAVKRLESISQGEKQFRTEVSTIGAIQHVNLVRLRGFCSEGNNKLLVYDYMPNGSLDSHLFHTDDSKVLDWKTRYQIALGTARGLFYLHEKCRDCIIHCDIKPENILLDAEFCPKVADFGLAKLVGRDFSRVLTTMRGTRGYLAPEWILGVAVTAKADVFSYGMMVFEFISGRRNSEISEDGRVKFFPTWAATVTIEGGDILSLLDHKLDRMADTEELTRLCRVACWCIQDDEAQRPTMGQVVQILEGVQDVNLPPTPRSLQVFVDNQENIVFFTESSSSEPRNNPSTVSTRSKSMIRSTSSN